MQAVEFKFGRFTKEGKRYRIHPDDGQTQQERTAEAVSAGYTVDVLGALRLEKKAGIAAARYDQEMGGFTNPATGMFVRTDARNRTLLNAAALRASADPAYEVPNWKTNEGAFITLSNSMILTLNGAVEQFIAAQFAKEAALSAQIDSATTPEEVNAIHW